MLVIKRYLLVFLIAFVFKTQAQDPLFTNNQQSLLYLNPSFAGSNGFMRYQTVYRNQWPNLSSPYVTFYNSFDSYIKRIKGGIALCYLNDNQANGTLITQRLDLTYAQHFLLMDKKLKIIPSLQITYLQKNIDITKLTFGSQIYQQNYLEIPSSKKSNIDFSSGLLINYQHLYFGASVFHFNQPDEGPLGYSKLPARLSMFASYNILLSQKTVLHFYGRYEKQQSFYFYQLGVNAVLFKHLIVGTGYKYSNSIFTNLGFKNNYFTLQAGYELYFSALSNTTFFSYEVSASFNFRTKEQRKTLTDFEKW